MSRRNDDAGEPAVRRQASTNIPPAPGDRLPEVGDTAPLMLISPAWQGLYPTTASPVLTTSDPEPESPACPPEPTKAEPQRDPEVRRFPPLTPDAVEPHVPVLASDSPAPDLPAPEILATLGPWQELPQAASTNNAAAEPPPSPAVAPEAPLPAATESLGDEAEEPFVDSGREVDDQARLVAVPPTVGAAAEPREVHFAAGAIRFESPEGWSSREATFQREIRVTMLPEDEAIDGRIWLTYHVLENATLDAAEAMLRKHLQEALPTAIWSEPRSLELGPSRGVLFTFASDDGGQPVQGWRAMLVAPWGFVEAQASASPDSWGAIAEPARNWFATLRVGEPAAYATTPETTVAAEARDAEPILGVWKGYRSKVRLLPDGRMLIEHDRVVDDSSPTFYNGPAATNEPMIVGRFVADEDLLQVRWEDGSQLSYRWRLNNGRLLLTDSEGLVSQLQRIWEASQPRSR